MTVNTHSLGVKNQALALMVLSALSGTVGCGDETGNGDGEARSTGPSQWGNDAHSFASDTGEVCDGSG